MDLDVRTDVPKHIALRLCVLMLEPETWINRRVEQVSYLDHNTIRRRMSIDFNVPEASGDGVQYLPVALFEKSKLVNFDMRDTGGTSVPMLTAEQNGHLSTAALTALAKLEGEDRIDSVDIGSSPSPQSFGLILFSTSLSRPKRPAEERS